MSFKFHRLAIVVVALVIGSNHPAEGSDSRQAVQSAPDALHLTVSHLEFAMEGLHEPLVLAQAEPDGTASTGGQGDEKSAASTPWTGNVEAGLQIREGNTETLDLYGKVEALRKIELRELSLKASYDYAERDDDTEMNRAFAEATYRRYRSPKAYIFGTVNVEHDEIEELDFRLNAAVGPGYKWIDTEDTKLIGEAGFGVTAEWYDGEDQHTEAIVLLHGLWTQKVFDASIFSQELTVYPSISDFGSFRLVSTTALATPLSKSLDLRVSLVNEYDNDPEVSGVEKNDMTFRTTLVYRF
jgi:putative salt-induced outer membrane protein